MDRIDPKSAALIVQDLQNDVTARIYFGRPL